MPSKTPLSTLLCVLALGACSHVPPADAPISRKATFVCGDSLPRADGTRLGTACVLAREYCYEASGGAAFSHGARCRPLPKPNARCGDIATEAGSSCTGTAETGLHVHFSFP